MITWPQHIQRWQNCQRCPLAQQRNRICFARGTMTESSTSDVLLIGEAPGISEDATGFPFKGPAGHLMDQIIGQSIPDPVTYILTNLVLCFPKEAKSRGDNEPEPEEILACRPRLIEFINIIQPRLIVTVGSLAERYVPSDNDVKRINIVHPAYILARLPRAQQHFAAQKCIVQIRCAVEDMLQCKPQPWKEWKDDEIKPTRQQLRRIYGEPESDDIPF